jgi:sterol desaturase/sphingolipid hydroxylase (fatty acid hydroxylase superfamily)
MLTMDIWLLTHEPAVRMACFLGTLGVMAVWEHLARRRHPSQSKPRRWMVNLGIVVLDSLMLRLLFPMLAVGFADIAHASGWGLFNRVAWPGWLEILLAVALLDLAIYAQHLAMHKVPVLWRLHRMHHSDLDFDTSTALRFHPLEIALSMLLKLGLIWLLGPAAIAVLLFEVLLNASALFNHGNVRLPHWADAPLRRLIVTPDMHRVHHSVRRDETNSNYGFNLSVWDRLFGTYRDQPAGGHEGMVIGLGEYRNPRELGLLGLMLQPFRTPTTTPDQP